MALEMYTMSKMASKYVKQKLIKLQWNFTTFSKVSLDGSKKSRGGG